MAKKLTAKTAPKVARTEEHPVASAILQHERWPRADVRAILKAMALFRDRQVLVHMGCERCKEYLRTEGVDNGGASLVVCGCTRRVWE